MSIKQLWPVVVVKKQMSMGVCQYKKTSMESVCFQSFSPFLFVVAANILPHNNLIIKQNWLDWITGEIEFKPSKLFVYFKEIGL